MSTFWVHGPPPIPGLPDDPMHFTYDPPPPTLDEIRERRAKVCIGPWWWVERGPERNWTMFAGDPRLHGYNIVATLDWDEKVAEPLREFIAKSIDDIGFLLSEVERLEKERAMWEETASMGCEEPDYRCRCPGCSLARKKAEEDETQETVGPC